MLTRRGLRIKVMQVLYMVSQDQTLDVKAASRRLDENIRNTYRSFLYLLDVLIQIANQVAAESERRKSKYIPSDEDMHFNTALYDNPIMSYLRNSEDFKKQLKVEKLHYTDEEELIPAIYAELRELEEYQTYKAQNAYTQEDHVRMLRTIVKKFLPENEAFDQYMEDMIPTWADDEQAVLPHAEDAIRHMPFSPASELKYFRYELPAEEVEFAHTLLEKAISDGDRFNQMIENRLQNWELDRVSVLDRILMRMALTEFIHLPTVPVKVSINEYLEISKHYSTPKSREFINGVLDKLMLELKAEGAILKTGRGLIE